MDILTHAVMGAAMAAGIAAVAPGAEESALMKPLRGKAVEQSTLSSPLRMAERRLAAGVGAFTGVLPDADVVIQSGGDALLVLDYHRHFTHALAFVPFGALIAAVLLWPVVRRRIDFGRLYLLCLAAYLPHLLLDACTSYGTHLWLPFSQQRAAWNLIAVVDPVFTLLLAIPLLIFLRQADSRAVRWGRVLALAYLGLGLFQQQRAETAALALAQQRGHVPGQLVAKPSMANLLLWRALYVHDGRVQVDAFHLGLTPRHYPGASAPLLDAAGVQQAAAGDAQRLRDIERFGSFSDGFLVLDMAYPGFVGDARYAMLPTAIAPIWGLEWRGTGAATEFVSRHDFSPAMRRAFFAMLLGRDSPNS